MPEAWQNTARTYLGRDLTIRFFQGGCIPGVTAGHELSAGQALQAQGLVFIGVKVCGIDALRHYTQLLGSNTCGSTVNAKQYITGACQYKLVPEAQTGNLQALPQNKQVLGSNTWASILVQQVPGNTQQACFWVHRVGTDKPMTCDQTAHGWCCCPPRTSTTASC